MSKTSEMVFAAFTQHCIAEYTLYTVAPRPDQRNAMSKVSKIHGTDFNALNAMYVEDVGDGVCGFYATLYAEYTLYTVAPRPARREGSL